MVERKGRGWYLLGLLVSRDGIFADTHLVWRLHLSQLRHGEVYDGKQESTNKE